MTPNPVRLPIDQLTQKFIDRFWNNVNKTTDCWVWLGNNTRVRLGEMWYVSRFAYYFRHKVDPYPLDVLHTCDNPKCVNPNHLFLGSQTDNNKDRDTKDRTKGYTLSNVVLSENDIPNIRWLLANGYTQRSIADHYSVSEPTIQAIHKNRHWYHVTGIVKPDWIK